MILLALIVRTAVGAVLSVYGVAKLSRLPFGANVMWRPTWVNRQVMVALVGVVSLLELLLGIDVAVGLGSVSYIIVSSAIIFIGVSIYGTLAHRHGGHCGCAGNRSARIENSLGAKTLWMRNGALFTVLAVGVLYAPSLNSLTTDSAALVPVLAIIPLSVLLITSLWRFIVAFCQNEVSEGRAALYRRIIYYA